MPCCSHTTPDIPTVLFLSILQAETEYKKILSVLLFFLVLLNTASPVLASSEITDIDAELSRAGQYGLIPDEMLSRMDETITFQEMCHMIKNEIERYFGEEKAKEFEDAAGPGMDMTEPMTRDAGILALFYAADIMEYSANYGEGFALHEEIGEKVWTEMQPDYQGAFPDFEQPSLSPIDCIKPEEGWGNHAVAAYFYLLTVHSELTEKLLLDYDSTDHSFHLDQPLTCEAAIKAVLRLLETNPPSMWEVPPVDVSDETE